MFILCTQLHLITLLQGLCNGMPLLTKSDVISLCAIIKSSKVPNDLSSRPNSDESENSYSSSSASSRAEIEENQKESKKIPLDHTCDSLIEQLMTPIVELNRKDCLNFEKNLISNFSTTQDSKVSHHFFSI